MRIGVSSSGTIEDGFSILITCTNRGNLKLVRGVSPSSSGGINAFFLTSVLLMKYISKAAYKLMNCPFLLWSICSPSNNELKSSLLDVIAPVNCTLIFVVIKNILPILLMYISFLRPSALSVTV